MGLRRFFFGKKYRMPATPRPRWLQLLIVIFVLFAAFKSGQKGTPEEPNPLHEAVKNTGQMVSKENLGETLATYKNLIFPRYNSVMELKDIAVGKGRPLLCGQEAQLTYSTSIEGGRSLPYAADASSPLVFRLGDGSVIPAIEQGVTGMRLGGKRTLIASPLMSYGINKFNTKNEKIAPDARVNISVELLSMSPEVPSLSDSGYRIAFLNDEGSGKPVFCGEKAKVSIVIWNMEGKKIFENKSLTFTPGKSEVFLGLEQGVIGILRKSKRLLVVPAEFQKTMNGNAPITQISFPEKQTVLVEVEALP